MATTPPIDATLTLTAELVAGMWTLYASNGSNRVALGAGPTDAGIMFPAVLLDRYAIKSS